MTRLKQARLIINSFGMLKLSFRATCSILHPHAAKNCCKYFAANFICGAINKNCYRNFTTSNKKMTLTRVQTIACISLHLDEDYCKDFCPSKRSVWVKSWLEKRAEQGAYHNLFQELLLGDAKSFKEFIRMDRLHFQFLVEGLYPRLIKQDTVMRKSIKPDEQCCLFLRYTTSGESFRSLEYQFRISRQIISRVISTAAKAIIHECKMHTWKLLIQLENNRYSQKSSLSVGTFLTSVLLTGNIILQFQVPLQKL